MTEEHLTTDQLGDRVWAILAATAEGRDADVDELLVALPWPDLITVVCGLGALATGAVAGHAGIDHTTARGRVADAARGLLADRIAQRERPDQ
ncbi:hypothetical protein ACGFS9_21255 [Streptomyces sp. NPDC048566]|uniref:hypothetical protein n=1 Tax=Streptomyces sp. NPDC048566 TaxID=3365569 RepID=UPI0037162D98